MKILILVVIWITACALQDYVFQIEEDVYVMLYGYFVGIAGLKSTGKI